MGGRPVGPWRRGVAGCTGTGGAITFFRGSESKRRETEGLERESDGRWEDKVRRVPHMGMALAARRSVLRCPTRVQIRRRNTERRANRVDFNNHSDKGRIELGSVHPANCPPLRSYNFVHSNTCTQKILLHQNRWLISAATSLLLNPTATGRRLQRVEASLSARACPLRELFADLALQTLGFSNLPWQTIDSPIYPIYHTKRRRFAYLATVTSLPLVPPVISFFPISSTSAP